MTSTVGLPRLSKIWRASSEVMVMRGDRFDQQLNATFQWQSHRKATRTVRGHRRVFEEGGIKNLQMG